MTLTQEGIERLRIGTTSVLWSRELGKQVTLYPDDSKEAEYQIGV